MHPPGAQRALHRQGRREMEGWMACQDMAHPADGPVHGRPVRGRVHLGQAPQLGDGRAAAGGAE